LEGKEIMMSQWFRFYESALDDPKVQRLPGDLFKGWINLLCLAKRHNGTLPPHEDIAFALRLSAKDATKLLDSLVEHGLLDHDETGISPHNWNARQYKSDVSTDRVKRFRKRQETVSETPSETDTDTDTDTDVPLAKANGHSPPVVQDITAVVFGAGLAWLAQSTGKSEAACRALLGKWRKQSGDEALIAALGRAQREGPIDAVAWMTKALKPPEKVIGWN
jgi:hypothetical protein